MEECESLDAEMTELQELECEFPEAANGQDDEEDEVEELQNSLREVVQDQSVKPKLQCLMVDPSFSMVTIQSEDSGIIWETASSRCSTPWASETSSISEAYSLEGPGSQGKITIVFDDEKIERRRKRSIGRSSRLSDRIRRPSSSRSSSALGVERLEMAEVSVPNVKPEKKETDLDLEEIKDKDQLLFSLISEGYEILNIRVPSKLPTVDEEESTELQDNLSYLEETPMIKSRTHRAQSQPEDHDLPGVEEEDREDPEEATEKDSSKPLVHKEFHLKDHQKDGGSDMDYFEKFTLVDVAGPAEQAPELQEEEVEQPTAKPQEEELKSKQETVTDVSTPNEDSFVFLSDLDLAWERLDEVFYGNVHRAPDNVLQRGEDDEEETVVRRRTRKESQKESGSALFGSEETVLTPIFLSPGPPKIIDQILLEEPRAMSFMYSDLYEDAMGERKKSDDEYSEVASERSFKRRSSDSEDTDGYLEKFILKDDTPTVEVYLEPEEENNGKGKRMWSQSKFELTGFLSRAPEETEEVEDKRKEPKVEEVISAERGCDVQQSTCQSTSPEASVQVPQPEKEKIEEQEGKQEVKEHQTEPTESSTEAIDTKIVAAVEEETVVPEEAAIDTKIVAAVEEETVVPEEAAIDTKIVAAVEEETVVPEEAAIDTKIVAAVEEETVVPEEAAIDTKIVAAVEEETVVPEEAAIDTKIVAAVEEGTVVPEEAAIDTKIVAAVEEGTVVPEEAAIDTKIVAAVEEETVVPEEAAIDTKIVAAVEEETVVPEEAAIDTKIVAAVEEGTVVPEEAAIDTKIVAAVEEETVVPEEAAIDTKIVAAVEEGTVVPEEAAIDTKIVAAVEEGTVVPEEAAIDTKIVAAVEEGTVVPEEAAIDTKIVATVEEETVVPEEAAIDTKIVAAVEEGTVVPEEAAIDTKIVAAVEEETVVPEEAAIDTKIVAAVEEETVVPEEAVTDTKIVAAVEEGTVVPEEAATDTKIVAAVEEETVVPEEAATDTKIVAAVEEETVVPEEAATDTKIVAAVEEETVVPEEAAIDTKIVAAVEEETVVPEEAAIDTKIVAAVEEETVVPEEAAIDTKIVAAVEEEPVVPEEAATDTKIVAAVEEGTVVPEEAAIDTKIVAAVEEETVVPEEAAIDTKIVAAVEEGTVVPEEAATDTKIVAAVEEETVVPEEAAIDTKIVDAVEEGTVVPEDAAIDTKIVDAVEEGTVVPEEAATDTKSVAAVEEGTVVPEEAATDTKSVAAVEEGTVVPEEAAIDTKIVDAVEEGTVVPEEAAIDTKIVATVEEGTVVPEDAAIDTKIVAAVEEGTVVPEEAAIEVQEPMTVSQEVVTCPESSVEPATPTELKENGKIEIVVVAGKTIPIEVIIDSEPVVEAVVELAEIIVDEGEVQTQVQIARQEVSSAETPTVKAEISEEEKRQEAVIEKTAAIADHEKEVKTETIPNGVMEHILSEEVKPHPDELVEVPEPAQSQQVEAVTDDVTEKPAEEVKAKTIVVTQDVVLDTVSVGDEFILLVPKGTAVEMNIEVGQWSDHLQNNDSVASLPPERPVVDLVSPGTSAPPKPKTKKVLDVKAELVMILPALKAPVSIKEVGVAEPKVEKNLEEEGGVLSILRSSSPQEDLPGLHTEEIVPQIQMHKEEVVLETHKEDAGPVMEVHKEAEISEIHKEDISPVTELHHVDVGPAMELHQEAEIPKAEQLKEDVGTETEVHKEAEVFETEIQKEDVIPVVEIPEKVEVLEILKEDVGLVMEVHKEDAGPVSAQHREADVSEAEIHNEEMNKEAEASETVGAAVELHREDVDPDMEHLKEDIGPATLLHKEAEVPDMEHLKEDIGPATVLHKEAEVPDMEHLKEDIGPATLLHKEAEVPDMEHVKEDIGPVTVLHKEAEVPDMEHLKEDIGPATLLHKEAEVLDMEHLKEDIGPATLLHKEAEVLDMEPHKLDLVPEVTAEDLEYEIISKQEVREMPEPEMERVAEESRPDSEPDTVERVEMEEGSLDLSPGEEFIDDDYDIIGAEEESQARAAAELQGMDWFCLTCGCLLTETDCVSGGHKGHEVTSVEKAYEDIKDRLGNWISELQGRSENMEDLVSELELAYNSVEDQCTESEGAMQAQNEEMMALVMEQYNSMSHSVEEEKKAKLEQLYDQIVTFQENIDSAKGTLETTAREAETDARSPEDINTRLRTALDSAMSLELGPRGLLVFEDYAKGNTSNSHNAQRKGIPVPQKPTLQLQELGSATTTSVTVYWRVNPGDIIDCFQVYCMEDPLGAVSEEYRVTVKESYCVLEELEPDRIYKVWVMAVNYTGCSLPSERLAFRTAPSVPVIDTERCTVLWDSATLRWTPASSTPAHSYTLEYCRQYELEGEGLRSISGIRGCEQSVILQPDENYLFYIKAVNEAGSSEQSEAALISTKGTRFHMLKASAHPVLELSEDQTTLHYSQDTYNNTPHADSQCPSILGELLPARGHYYWETTVSGSTSYRIGVAYGKANRNSPLGENSASWCLHCIPTPSSCRFELLHNDVQSDVFVIEVPERVGTLLDFQHDSLSFYNAKSGQLLGSLSHHFAQPCHPVLGMELPGSLEVSTVPELPEFAKHG